jgi:hypothetical protein
MPVLPENHVELMQRYGKLHEELTQRLLKFSKHIRAHKIIYQANPREVTLYDLVWACEKLDEIIEFVERNSEEKRI